MRNRRENSRRNPRRDPTRSLKMVADVIDPPRLPSVTQFTRTYRFNCTGNLGVTVTSSNLVGVAGAMCTTTNSTLTFIAFAAKVHSIQVWAPASTNGVMVQIEVQWYTMNQGPAREIENVSMSTARPGYLRTKPQVGEWGFQRFSAGATPVFGIACPTGSVIDIRMTHWLSDLAGANTTQSCTVATLGELYYPALDGTTKTAVPVGLPMAA